MHNLFSLIGLAATLTLAPSVAPNRKPYPDRAKFAARMAKVRPDQSKAEVEALLGPPDYVYTFPGSGAPEKRGESWRYGVEGDSKVPTLGEVLFYAGKVEDVSGRMSGVTGRAGSPPPPSVISERELRAGISRVYIQSGGVFRTHDLLHRIRSVNYLRRLGAARARAVLSECSRIATVEVSDESFIAMAMALFEVPSMPAYLPRPGVWAARGPEDRTLAPRYPIFLVDDIPFDAFGQGILGTSGQEETTWEYLRRIPETTPIRKSDLKPPPDPFAVVGKLLQGREWKASFPAGGQWWERPKTERLWRQVLGLARTVYARDDEKVRPMYLEQEDFDRYHSEFLKIHATWDPRRQDYVRPGGSFEPIHPMEDVP